MNHEIEPGNGGTGVSHDEAVTLLQIAAVYDNRDIDQLIINAWLEAARRQRWTFPEAADAVHQHYSKHTAWLMPGHITQIIRRGRGRNWQE
ncbi:hypothetical protein [Nocardia wallacei]|uniref:hypothetical protein n=1 Tax=Nocardia wallacei TaxID=480035 RepID=UPI0024552D23|nr:hypothetical protein [Nocardia wallacei]